MGEPNKRLERTRHEQPSLVSCVGEPLKRNVRFLLIVQAKMDNDLLKKWESVLASLTVVKKSKLICSVAQIDQVEKELGFKFPAGYPEYCRVFGSGSFGWRDAPDFFRVYCPCCPPSSFDIRRTGGDLIGLKLDLQASGPVADEEKEKVFYRLLESGYPFAGTDAADSFIWDLTTYSKADRSYDIYWKPDERIDEIAPVGRDFFEFINEFCLADKWKILFPEEYVTDSPEIQERFFTAYEQHDNSRSYDLFRELMFERFWGDVAGDVLSSESDEVRLNCGYDAPGKEQAECLLRAWGQEEGVGVEIISASERPNIPRLVEVTVTIGKGQITPEYMEGLSRKMVRIGEECDALLTSFGSGAFTVR